MLTHKVHRFMRLSLYPYTSNCPIQLERRLIRLAKVFLDINSPMEVLVAKGCQQRRVMYSTTSCHVVNNVLSWCQQRWTSSPWLWQPISTTVHWKVRTNHTCWWPRIEIYRNIRKYYASILFKDFHQSSTIRFFEGLFQRCLRFDSFSDTWYSLCTFLVLQFLFCRAQK